MKIHLKNAKGTLVQLSNLDRIRIISALEAHKYQDMDNVARFDSCTELQTMLRDNQPPQFESGPIPLISALQLIENKTGIPAESITSIQYEDGSHRKFIFSTNHHTNQFIQFLSN